MKIQLQPVNGRIKRLIHDFGSDWVIVRGPVAMHCFDGSYDGSNLDTCALTILDNQIPAYTQLHRYVGAGTDFNLHFFLNVPSLVCYASIPNPA